MPGLPLVLTFGGWLAGDPGASMAWRLLGVVAAGIGAIALYALGKSIGGPACGVTAALLWALMPMRLMVAPMLLAEPVFIPLLVAAVAVIALRSRRIELFGAGVLVALTFLIRGGAVVSILGLVLGATVVAASRRGITKRLIANLALVMSPVLLVAGIWTIRNVIEVGAPVVTETKADYQLFIGLDASTRTFPYQSWRADDPTYGAMMFGDRPDLVHGGKASPEVQHSAQLLAQGLTEPERARRLRASALQHVRDYPFSVARHLANMVSALLLPRPDYAPWNSHPPLWPSLWSERPGWAFSVGLVLAAALWLLLGGRPIRSPAAMLLLIMLIGESLLLVLASEPNEPRVRLLFNAELLPFAAAGIVLTVQTVLPRARSWLGFAVAKAA
jgi:hypothetical protein